MCLRVLSGLPPSCHARLGEPATTISHFNPFFHLIDGFRYGFTGHAEGNLTAGALYTLVITLALCAA